MVSSKKLVDEMPTFIFTWDVLNNRHKILAKWILLSLSNNLPALAMKFKFVRNQ